MGRRPALSYDAIGMRCPTCGTENAQDSRFCGGCGARLEPARVAPTVKLPDDAPIAPASHVPPVRLPTPVPASIPTPPPGSLNQIGHLPTPAPGSMSLGSLPPQPRAGSIPPQNAQPAIPNTVNRAASPRPGTPPPVVMSSPSLSMAAAAPRRSGALIAVVLVADLGLAAAGAFMLAKGLHKPGAKPAQKAEGTAPAPTQVAAAPAAPPPAPAPAAAPAGSATVEPPRPEPVSARGKDTKHHADKKSTSPEDPYAGQVAPDLSADVERAAGGSVGSFRACLQDAIQTQPIHGDVRVAFMIQPDGRVDHAHAVVNTTGSEPLATCLAATIATWTFAPHPGPAASYERPFNYP